MSQTVSDPLVDKVVETQYPIEAVIQNRWSPLAFSDRLVEPEKLRSVLEAARWAASSYNEQPWNFIVATKDNPAEFDRLLSCLAEGNQEWAQSAPVLMISVAKLNFEKNGTQNRHAFHDVGAAEANLAIQATALGLHVHQMAGFDVEKARELYGIPQGYEPVDAVALGYLGDPYSLSDKLQQRLSAPRSRKPLESFVFTGRWQQSSNLLR
ncbi:MULTISPECIES: nitroreductase family protein [Leptolyngbya]|jgi:nitroreductase|uniref:Nitroreductase n=2 Tax=Leptolyngbya boryana TaxID=1184 RepID=A0A1Z4JGB2_LEPBY|nr:MULTISPECIES: nitroreductase family protein [Leptolyngbya]BAY55789.1 nitroreductase [Leptolyngbya boryana NIES-2135]MBD1854689.1 nitroreductase family protein [Leptolyngbya sp. FACHB-1624]MBD2370318.1 nitroreductase family protein [Leptolyngbya sp. FACHB-161]MBD2376662.1 nitroreductase family protein [Leptolyngbya sp. FACHB-238]MBD2400932.1 nitroreductase family protein [Leptolyngbya sp. FACHB-239]